MIYFSTQLSPRRLGILFFLDKKQNQKNQDWLMQPCNAAPTSHYPVMALLFFAHIISWPLSVKSIQEILSINLISKPRIKAFF